MKKMPLLSWLIPSLSIFFFSTSYAEMPLWSFTPLTATTLSLLPNTSATVQYIIKNQSKKTHTLAMRNITGIAQNTNSGFCSHSFTLASQQSCVLNLLITADNMTGSIVDGPIVCDQNNPLQCYRPGKPNILQISLGSAPTQATLTSSSSSLALQINGSSRTLAITNIGLIAAINVTYSPSPSLPAGTVISPANCGDIAPGATCNLIVTPGATPTAPPADTSPQPIVLTIAGSNTNTLTPNINVLTYGSVYQSGYLFSIDDTTQSNLSIAGKVMTLNDQGSAYWSVDNLGNPVTDNILGIYESSTNPPDACNGNTDGSCDTNVIVNFYPLSDPNLYAAGMCKATIDGYSDWYLPSICELGYDGSSAGTGCGTQVAPTIQNIQSNLLDNSILNFSNDYLSSTEFSGTPTTDIWEQLLNPTFGSQGTFTKTGMLLVRCVRALN